MVKAVTTRSGMRETPSVKKTEKQPPLDINLPQRQQLVRKLQATAVKITPRIPQ